MQKEELLEVFESKLNFIKKNAQKLWVSKFEENLARKVLEATEKI